MENPPKPRKNDNGSQEESGPPPWEPRYLYCLDCARFARCRIRRRYRRVVWCPDKVPEEFRKALVSFTARGIAHAFVLKALEVLDEAKLEEVVKETEDYVLDMLDITDVRFPPKVKLSHILRYVRRAARKVLARLGQDELFDRVVDDDRAYDALFGVVLAAVEEKLGLPVPRRPEALLAVAQGSGAGKGDATAPPGEPAEPRG